MSLLLLDKDELVCFAAFLSVAEVAARLFDVGRRHVEEIGILLFSLCAFRWDEELDEFDIHLIVLVVDSHLRQIAAANFHRHVLSFQVFELNRLVALGVESAKCLAVDGDHGAARHAVAEERVIVLDAHLLETPFRPLVVAAVVCPKTKRHGAVFRVVGSYASVPVEIECCM